MTSAISNIQAHLNNKVSSLKLVGSSADFQQAVENNPTITPAAFVFDLMERAHPSPVSGLMLQRIDIELAVVIVVRHLGGVNAAREDIQALKSDIKAALMGYAPVEGYEPLERTQGKLMAFKDGYMWWMEQFKTSYLERGVL